MVHAVIFVMSLLLGTGPHAPRDGLSESTTRINMQHLIKH